MSKLSNLSGTTVLSRRTVLRSGGLAAAGAALGAPAVSKAAASAAEPTINSSFKDFTLPKFHADDSLVKIQQKGELQLCTSNDWPYSYLDEKTNEFSGIDADILRFVTKMLNIGKITVNTVPFDGMIPGLLDGRFDIVGNSIRLYRRPGQGRRLHVPDLLLLRMACDQERRGRQSVRYRRPAG